MTGIAATAPLRHQEGSLRSRARDVAVGSVSRRCTPAVLRTALNESLSGSQAVAPSRQAMPTGKHPSALRPSCHRSGDKSFARQCGMASRNQSIRRTTWCVPSFMDLVAGRVPAGTESRGIAKHTHGQGRFLAVRLLTTMWPCGRRYVRPMCRAFRAASGQVRIGIGRGSRPRIASVGYTT
jgi:hypothetical protein